MDQHNDELKYSNVKGKNPFKDMRVRRALNMAVDREAIKRVTMRGLSIPAGIMVAPGVHGYCQGASTSRAPVRRRRREEAARRGRLSERLRVHARLPEQPLRQRRGDLPGAGRHVGARSASRPKLNAMPFATFIPKIQNFDTSAYMLGWGVATFDALYIAAVAGAHQDRPAPTAASTSAASATRSSTR